MVLRFARNLKKRRNEKRKPTVTVFFFNHQTSHLRYVLPITNEEVCLLNDRRVVSFVRTTLSVQSRS